MNRASRRPLHTVAGESVEVRSRGFNTDADAIIRSLEEDLSLSLAGARVLLLGAGGAGRTAALKLASKGVSELFIVNRTQNKAADLANEIRGLYPQPHIEVGYPSGIVDLLLNATSLGLRHEDPLPLDQNTFQLRNARAVYDMVYRPSETALLQAAKAAGCRAVNGLGMLLYQGVKALEIWTGQPAPVEIMRRALRKSVYGS